MAVKHIISYYDELTAQYKAIQDNLKLFEKEAEEGLVEPERFEQMKKDVQVVIDNYRTISYIIFLLNKPQRNSKIKSYEKRNRKFLESIPYKNTKDGIVEQNNKMIDKQLKSIKKN